MHGVYSAGNWRQHVAQWSMQITSSAAGNIQMDIDPNNPDMGFWAGLRHGGNVIANTLTNGDTPNSQYFQLPMSTSTRYMKSRRYLLRVLVATLPLMQRRSTAQDTVAHNASPPQMKPSREWNNAYLAAISPSGDTLGLYFTERPLTEFSVSGEKWTFSREAPQAEFFAIFKTASPGAIYTAQLPARPSFVSFFGDGETVYLETPFPPDFRSGQRLLINLKTGKLDKGDYYTARNHGYTQYYPLDNHVLLGVEAEPNPTRAIALIRAILPDYREIARTSYTLDSVKQDDSVSRYWTPVISDDRKSFVYMLGHTIVLRRAQDLGLVWTKQIGLNLYGVGRLAITANGSRVAAAVIDFVRRERQPNDFVGVYDGLNGDPVAKLPVSGKDGLAISPDGSRIAIGRVLHRDRDVKLLADVYEVNSGRMLASYEHDVVPPGKYQGLIAKIERIEFTSDGNYLITSGNNRVRVWQP
jgi:hypothetical protein